MNFKKSKILIILCLIAALVGAVFYFRYQVLYSHGKNEDKKIIQIEKGDGIRVIASKLKRENLISKNIYFYYYIQRYGLVEKILPGKYELSGNMTIPEIAIYMTKEENILPGYFKITFPEGWTSKQIAERLSANGLDGKGFLGIVENPPTEITKKYDFLMDSLNHGKAIEGYLFPDTYFFSKAIDAEGIIKKILDNFDKKITPNLLEETKKQNKSIYEIITMASIIEGEVRTDEDRALVSGIYWNRVKNGQALQSDITIAYILGEKKKQYSFDDTRMVSPYNTYINKGLPPGPINNPGISAIKAAIYPKNSDYNYYLSDPKTGQTIFAKTYAEHVANKVKYGL